MSPGQVITSPVHVIMSLMYVMVSLMYVMVGLMYVISSEARNLESPVLNATSIYPQSFA